MINAVIQHKMLLLYFLIALLHYQWDKSRDYVLEVQNQVSFATNEKAILLWVKQQTVLLKHEIKSSFVTFGAKSRHQNIFLSPLKYRDIMIISCFAGKYTSSPYTSWVVHAHVHGFSVSIAPA